MKRLIVSGVVMLVSFAFGVGLDRLIWNRSNAPTPSMQRTEYGNCDNVNPHTQPIPVMTPVATLPSDSQPKLILDFDYKRFDPIGIYFIMGPTPKEFADITSFELGYDEFIDDQPTGYISVLTKNNDDYESYHAVFGLITQRRVFFVTGPGRKTDYEYWFDGEFVRTDFEAVSGKKKAVLRGTLTKTKQGRKVAERVVSFWLETHVC